MISSLSPFSHKRMALFLSGLVLPGLGQIHLGFKVKGWAMILLAFSDIILTFAKFMMGLFQVVEKYRYPRPPTLNVFKHLTEAYQTEKTWILCGIAGIFLLWVWSILDIVWTKKEN